MRPYKNIFWGTQGWNPDPYGGVDNWYEYRGRGHNGRRDGGYMFGGRNYMNSTMGNNGYASGTRHWRQYDRPGDGYMIDTVAIAQASVNSILVVLAINTRLRGLADFTGTTHVNSVGTILGDGDVNFLQLLAVHLGSR